VTAIRKKKKGRTCPARATEYMTLLGCHLRIEGIGRGEEERRRGEEARREESNWSNEIIDVGEGRRRERMRKTEVSTARHRR
jgi:hypothetical protein